MAGGSMPNIEWKDGTRIGSTNALVRMLGAKYGYYPEDAMMAYQNDFLMDLNADYWDKMIGMAFDGAAKEGDQAALDKHFEVVDKYLAFIEPFA